MAGLDYSKNADSIDNLLVREARKGRGAASNRAGRYERHAGEACDDGWGNLEEPQEKLQTIVQADHSRTVITRNASPDLGVSIVRSTPIAAANMAAPIATPGLPMPFSASLRDRTSRAGYSPNMTLQNNYHGNYAIRDTNAA